MEQNDLINIMNQRKILFNQMIEKSEEHLGLNNLELSSLYCQIAADYVSYSHAGFFYSNKLEEILSEISLKVIKNDKLDRSKNKIQKVLHIASELYAVGGHTRLLQNWINYDVGRYNELVITNQTMEESPKQIIEELAEKGITVTFLKGKSEGILSRAIDLVSIAKEFDAVVLHIHSYDVIPLIAFSNSQIPVLLMNHADHRFWIGRSISNMVLELRETGKSLSMKRRLISPENQSILPIPLKGPVEITKEKARKALSINSDDFVIFSVASSYKYKPLHDGGLGEVLLPLVNRYSNLKALIVGPNHSEEYWKDLSKKSNGKIQALGIKPHVDYYYKASDLYLDSYPVSSLTSLLDAGKYSLPIFSLEKGSKGLDLDDISLDQLNYKSGSLKELYESLQMYIEDEKKREEFGNQCFDEISKYHLNPGWVGILDEIFNKVLNTGKIRKEEDTSKIIDKFDYPLVYMHHKHKSKEYELLSSFSNSFVLFPFSEKLGYIPAIVKTATKEPKIGKLLLPNGVKKILKKLMT
ncbi:hypothetical protein [Bacillus sp. 1P02SD]|uniref:hypothetical protein n=1 Tax=Bacillus sp. 1P02SD TaxID=3132264 RepID=UPI0039A0C6FD